MVTVKTQPKPSPFLAKPSARRGSKRFQGVAGWWQPGMPQCSSTSSPERWPKGIIPSVCVYFLFPHSKSKSRGARCSSPLCFSRGSRSVGEPCSVFQQKGIPAERPTPFRKKPKETKTRQREGNLPPLWMKKKGEINPKQPRCAPGLAGDVRIPEFVVVVVGKVQLSSRHHGQPIPCFPGHSRAWPPWHQLLGIGPVSRPSRQQKGQRCSV